MPTAYAKPFLTYPEQLALLESRGLICADPDRAMAVLRAVGYYHFSGYLYPYRLPAAQASAAHGTAQRLDQVAPGTRFEQVESLIAFDRRLRSVLLEGVLLVEIGVLARIAHVLGRRDPFGHLTAGALEAKACSRVNPKTGKTAFARWNAEYTRLQNQAKNEAFVQHNLAKYGEPLPIWIACEFLDFGAMSNLYRLLKYEDRAEVASGLGLGRERMLASWLTALNYSRNICAHNGRLWNRVMTVKPAGQPTADLPPLLAHLGAVSNERSYFALAITAHLIREPRPGHEWRQAASAVIASFPEASGRSAGKELGLPANWRDETLWR